MALLYNHKRRVVITGIGLVTPLGVGIEANWEALLAGRSGIRTVTRFDLTDFPVRIAGEVSNFDVQQFIDKKEARKMDLFVHYAIAAADLAIKNAGIDLAKLEGENTGVYVGSGIGGLGSIEDTHRVLLEKGPSRVSPYFIIQTIINEASAHISIRYKARGPNMSNVTACSTGAHAIGESFRMIQFGLADRMIAGGAEAPITPLSLAGFSSMKALSERNDEPEKACRPFDAQRDGFVMSEGAGIVLLEELNSALDRGAKIYAEIAGYGLNGDAYHVTAPSPDGEGAARVMKLAIDEAGISPADIQYINAHGTSTPYNDRVETMAIKSVFGEAARKVAVSSTKSMTGHLLGAAGGIEAGITALTIDRQVIPPTINYEFPDPDCDLDYVPNKPRAAEVIYALTNSFGFGGTNACLLLKKFEG
ncbi:MAG TPA: beta-ketoacyl-ACP synthase II [Candidatus Saccharicenans sp.]|jgi:3-oxoacyl-[acyl-carrier-protein] synthase II|nr:beta-ketoacyl-ACP synthase II [Candidatus Saccharicenans sp.]HOT68147.1 beta-ketoacyl-ACP synthase II [Candidatus Saccharicenans sp.]HPC87416.1 beta-ketoacyl-ACP synthase II [Candidatus Saccharicenans sp.]HQE63523.1 beta-ketoacyl-ACP synthase II [Candidatus Saccharicenans sp.]HQH60173.1 beta-ketoacyl-ACP synthase II [Candidatus Saccharicenans sp.]